MPVVFVHGINNRPGASWEQGKVSRHSLFRRFMYSNLVSDPSKIRFYDPMWGPLGATFAWDHAALPGGADDVEALGTEDHAVLEVVASSGADLDAVEGDAILQTARQSLEVAVDILWAGSGEHADAAEADSWAELARQANAYARNFPSPPWLSEVQNDEQFIRRLQGEVEAAAQTVAEPDLGEGAAEALGAGEVWDKILETADRVNHAIEGNATRLILAVAREGLQRDLGLAIGDILVYIQDRGTSAAPGKIINAVVQDIEAARGAITPEDPQLMVVGHSMGGIILYEILSYFRPDIHVDVFASVGSQIGVLEEIKVLRASDRNVGPRQPQTRVAALPNVKRWINVFDPNDPGSFATEAIFEGTTDYRYTTGLTPRAAHSGYFIRPSFYERLAARVAAP